MNDLATKETQLVQTLQSTALRAYLRTGDLSQLPEEEKDKILVKMCAHYGLDPILRPFIMINLRGEGGTKQIWYPTKAATDQMACNKSLTRKITDIGVNESAGIVTCRCLITDGERVEEAIAAVPVIEYVRENSQVTKRLMTGEGYANAIMKAETKAKRRATMCWFGIAEPDYDTPPQVAANVVAVAEIAEASNTEDNGTAEQPVVSEQPRKRRRTRAEIEAEKMAAKLEGDRLHLQEQIDDTLEAKHEVTGILAHDKDGHLVGTDNTTPLGKLCAQQMIIERNANDLYGKQLSLYNRTIDLHKEQLKQALQKLGIDWQNAEHIKIATKISMAANNKAPVMSGLNILTKEFGEWIEAEWLKHFHCESAAPAEIPL